MSREARKGTLGAVHPSFNLLNIVRTFLIRDLPDNAHLLATGRLCVSLTRVSNGTNMLVSEFDSKEDLIQVNSTHLPSGMWRMSTLCNCTYLKSGSVHINDSHFDIHVQALVCSCFYPLYCGVIPPSYHGIVRSQNNFCDPCYKFNLWFIFNAIVSVLIMFFRLLSEVCRWSIKWQHALLKSEQHHHSLSFLGRESHLSIRRPL